MMDQKQLHWKEKGDEDYLNRVKSIKHGYSLHPAILKNIPLDNDPTSTSSDIYKLPLVNGNLMLLKSSEYNRCSDHVTDMQPLNLTTNDDYDYDDENDIKSISQLAQIDQQPKSSLAASSSSRKLPSIPNSKHEKSFNVLVSRKY